MNRIWWTVLVLCSTGSFLISCKSPRSNNQAVPNPSEQVPRNTPSPEEISYLLSTGQIILVFEDDFTQAAKSVNTSHEQDLALGKAKVVDTNVPGSFKKLDIVPADYIEKLRKSEVKINSDSAGVYGKYYLEKDTADADINIFQKNAVEGLGIFVVPKSRGFWGFTTSYLEVRDVASADKTLSGISYQGFTDQKLGDLVEGLRQDFDNPTHIVGEQRPLSVKFAKGTDPDVVVARLKAEFGDKYDYTYRNKHELEISRKNEVVQLKYGEDLDFPFISGMSLKNIKEALLTDKLVAPDARTLVVAPKGVLDWAEIEKSGYYKTVQNLVLTKPEPRLIKWLGRGMEMYYVHSTPLSSFKKQGKRITPNPILSYDPKQIDGLKADPLLLKKNFELVANDLYRGVQWIPDTTMLTANPGKLKRMGKGGWGSVSRVELNGKAYAEKVFFAPMNNATIREITSAITFGNLGLGPRVMFVDTTVPGRPRYTMEAFDSDASSTRMTNQQIISYGSKLQTLSDLSWVHLDDKVQNILLKGNDEAVLHDFAFAGYLPEGTRLSRSDYGTYAPWQNEGAPLTSHQVASFSFSLNVLRNRLGNADFETFLAGTTKRDGVLLIDGSALARNLTGLHEKAGMTEPVFRHLLAMLNTRDHTLRPSVKSFIEMISPKAGVSKVDVPKAEVSKVDDPKAEASKVDVSKADSSAKDSSADGSFWD